MEEKIEIPAFINFYESVSKSKIMTIEHFLQELLNSKGENWTYF